MSLHYKRKRENGTLAGVVTALKQTIRNEASEFSDEESAKSIISLENLSDAQHQNFTHSFESMMNKIEDHWKDHLPNGDKLTEAQKAAGAIVAMSYAAPGAYAEKAYSVNVSQEKGVTVIDPVMFGGAGSHDFRMKASMEAFDEQELRQHLPFSIAFNVQAARQDEFSESFYPTVVVTPDQAGLDVVVRRTLVYNEVRHSLTGGSVDFNRKNLIDAVIDHTILASESVRAVPVYVSGTNNAHFVTALATAYTIDNTTFQTAPLKMGVEHNLLGLSSHPGLTAAGVLDNTDSLDARIHLENIYVDLTGGGPNKVIGTGTDDVSGTVALSVDRLPYSAFVKPVENNYRVMTLNFVTEELVLSASTPDTAGVALSAGIGATYFTANPNAHVKLKVKLNGSVNVEFGNIEVHAASIAVVSVWEKDPSDGTFTNISNDAGGTLATQLLDAQAQLGAFVISGYDVWSTRSNQNRRVRGLIVDTTEQVERHTVMMGSPITVLSPVTSNRDASDLTAAVAAARIRNSNQAVTTLGNYAETLELLVQNRDRNLPISDIEGAGRWLVRPFFEKVELDLVASVNSVKSHERALDVSATIVNAIREVAYRMYRESGYQVALDAVTGGTGEKPTLIIGTDPVLAKHMQISGDTRLAGVALDYKIVTSMDQRVYNKIYLAFVRPGQTGPDPLSFGTHVWIPELAATVQVSRGGSTVKEAQVQPRNRHINNCPILGYIEVTGLKEAVTEKTSIDYLDVTP